MVAQVTLGPWSFGTANCGIPLRPRSAGFQLRWPIWSRSAPAPHPMAVPHPFRRSNGQVQSREAVHESIVPVADAVGCLGRQRRQCRHAGRRATRPANGLCPDGGGRRPTVPRRGAGRAARVRFLHRCERVRVGALLATHLHGHGFRSRNRRGPGSADQPDRRLHDLQRHIDADLRGAARARSCGTSGRGTTSPCFLRPRRWSNARGRTSPSTRIRSTR